MAEETVLSLEPVDCWQAVRKGAQRDRELFREGEIERKAAECWEKLLKPSPQACVLLAFIPYTHNEVRWRGEQKNIFHKLKVSISAKLALLHPCTQFVIHRSRIINLNLKRMRGKLKIEKAISAPPGPME